MLKLSENVSIFAGYSFIQQFARRREENGAIGKVMMLL